MHMVLTHMSTCRESGPIRDKRSDAEASEEVKKNMHTRISSHFNIRVDQYFFASALRAALLLMELKLFG
jgi:hypothetical protein